MSCTQNKEQRCENIEKEGPSRLEHAKRVNAKLF